MPSEKEILQTLIDVEIDNFAAEILVELELALDTPNGRTSEQYKIGINIAMNLIKTNLLKRNAFESPANLEKYAVELKRQIVYYKHLLETRLKHTDSQV
jgi:hypothetical protein